MRARNLKPGFFVNEDLVELPALARLLFAGLWCMADREGRTEDRPKRIKLEVLPADDCDVDTLLDALAGKGLIIRYEIDGGRYIGIPNFSKHQSPHIREAASTIPEYNQDTTKVGASPGKVGARHCQDPLNPDCGILNPESIEKHCRAEAPDDTPSGREFNGQVRGVFEYWQKRCGHPQAKFTPDRRQKIVARLREGATVERLNQAIDGCAGSKFHMGENDQGRRYDSIELIFRSAGKVDEFADMASGRDPTITRLNRIRDVRHEAGDVAARALCKTEDEWQEVMCGD